jgi:hypothetical protein
MPTIVKGRTSMVKNIHQSENIASWFCHFLVCLSSICITVLLFKLFYFNMHSCFTVLMNIKCWIDKFCISVDFWT